MTTGMHPVIAIAAFLLAGAAAARAQDLPSGPLSLAGGRLVVGTDISVSATPQDDQDGSWFNYTDYEHNALRLFRIGVNADMRLTDRVSVLTEVRTENGDALKPYALYIRVRPWRNRSFDVQAGRIPPTFGAFARRNYGSGNPVIGYPLAYQYLTAVRPDAIPSTTDDVLRMRARGWRPSYPIGSLDAAPGMPLVTAFRWDTGIEARIGFGGTSGKGETVPDVVRASVAVTTGTMSDPRTRDNNGGKQISGRVEWRPSAAFVLGGSAARGPYVSDSALAATTLAAGSIHSSQRAFGVDAELSRGYWAVRGEAIWNSWQVPTLSKNLDAASGFVEGSYKLFPGLFVAGRLDRLSFAAVPSAFGPAESWDAAVTRIEAGAGYYLRRNLIAKGTYQHNWRDGGPITSRGLVAFQLHFWM